jgi:hypothetical protein
MLLKIVLNMTIPQLTESHLPPMRPTTVPLRLLASLIIWIPLTPLLRRLTTVTTPHTQPKLPRLSTISDGLLNSRHPPEITKTTIRPCVLSSTGGIHDSIALQSVWHGDSVSSVYIIVAEKS